MSSGGKSVSEGGHVPQPYTASEPLIKGRATICVVNYRTLEYTRLCLRSIRRFTSYPADVVVVDNGSGDDSTDYLQSLDWITLLSRSCRRDRGGSEAHGRALDLAFSQCRTEFFVTLHSDTIVRRENWLTELIGYFDAETACVGSGKLEMRPLWQQKLRKATDWRMLLRRLRNPSVMQKYAHYNRTICCLYRTEVLWREGLTFIMGNAEGMNPGKQLYFELLKRGYPTVELPSSVMSRYVWHIAHATEAVVIRDYRRRKHTLRKSRWRIAEIMSQPIVQELLRDNTLD
jgi:glycosyltransferase involved in cell wall biosynthesis